MAITRSTPITQEDMQALADLANSVLLPLVNSVMGASPIIWPAHSYTINDGGGYGLTTEHPNMASPQPDYDFSGPSSNWVNELNRIRADYWNLVFGQYGTDGNALGQNTLDTSVYLSPDNIVSGPWVVGVSDPDVWPYSIYFFQDLGFFRIINFNYDQNLVGTLIIDDTSEFIVYKDVRFYYAEDDAPDGLTISTGRYVGFGYGAPTNHVDMNYNAELAGLWSMELTWQFLWTGGGTPPGAPPISACTFDVTGGADITWTTQNDAFNNSAGVGDNFYILKGVFSLNVAGSGTVGITATVPAGFELLMPQGTSFIEFSSSNVVLDGPGIHPSSATKYVAGYAHPANCNFTLNGNLAYAGWRMSDSNVKGVWIAKTLPVPAQNVFLDQDMPPYVGHGIPNLNGNGQFVAVSESLYWFTDYLDNPPVGQPAPDNPRFDSSMRQQARGPQNGDKIEVVGGYPFDLGPKYNLISESCQPQAAQWLVRRDTDFVPFDFGFNFISTVFSYSVQTVVADPGNTGINLNLYNFPVGNSPVGGTARAVKIRLVAPSSTAVGWKDGEFQYGDTLETALKIFVAVNDYPTTSDADFSTTDNQVTIDGTPGSDGGMHYLAALKAGGGINIAIQNLTGADVEYDIIFEIDYDPNPKRQYFPPYTECFCYSIDGTPPGNNLFYNTSPSTKPIPQSGYCIFKVRATRMPVQNSAGISITPSSGPEINIMLGQNRLAPDNTLSFAPFLQDIISPGAGDTGTGAGDMGMGAGGSGQPAMITIPATARDTGDVDVFIPVLSGNELVWQCDDDVIVEAWANWQPVFFFTQYGTFSHYSNYDATAFQYCLAFTNWFDPSVSNYPGFGGYATAPKVQFPPSIEIYKDLEACLNLI